MKINSENYKSLTKSAYDKLAPKFGERFAEYRKYIVKDVEEFLKKIPKGSKILDIGSGAGDQSLFFKEKGYDIFCIDISKEMVRLCKGKGLSAEVMDLEDLKFEPHTFDAVWAYTSLLHIPKSHLDSALKKIKEILKPNGIFFLGMKKGESEGFVEKEKYPGAKRWFSLFSDKELRKYLESYFVIEYFSEVKPYNKTFLNYICRSK